MSKEKRKKNIRKKDKGEIIVGEKERERERQREVIKK